MKHRMFVILGWAILAICVINVGVTCTLFTLAGQPAISNLPLLLAFLAFPLVGAFIVSQRPANTIGWLFCAAGVGTLVSSFSAAYVQMALHLHTDAQLATGIIDLIGNLIWPTNLFLGVLLLFLFPDGRPLSPRWRFVVWAFVLDLILVLVTSAVRSGPMEANNRVPNPLGIPDLAGISTSLANGGQSLLFLFILLAILSLVLRYRRAPGGGRQQIKWFVYGSALTVVISLTGGLIAGFISNDPTDPVAWGVSSISFALGILALPLGVGVGVLRYRLYDIDVIINRTLVYGSLTTILAALYFALVLGAQMLTRLLTGQPTQSPVVIVLSTLAIAALVQPLRTRLQRGIDRRFYRRRYDAAKTLAAFSATLRQEVELDGLRAHLLEVIGETMQPEHISLWLRPREGEAS